MKQITFFEENVWNFNRKEHRVLRKEHKALRSLRLD